MKEQHHSGLNICRVDEGVLDRHAQGPASTFKRIEGPPQLQGSKRYIDVEDPQEISKTHGSPPSSERAEGRKV